MSVRPKNRPALFDVSLVAQSGEITLIAGLQESGLGTLENVLMGMEKERVNGTCMIGENGKTKIINLKSGKFTPQFLRHKTNLNVALIPSDRTYRASNPELSIEQLTSALYHKRDSKNYTAKIIKKAAVAIQAHEKAAALSGGMLQRLILARELDRMPSLIIASEPLQGLDVAISKQMTELLFSFAKKNCIVIVLSATEFPEALCGAVYRLESGTLRGENA